MFSRGEGCSICHGVLMVVVRSRGQTRHRGGPNHCCPSIVVDVCPTLLLWLLLLPLLLWHMLRGAGRGMLLCRRRSGVVFHISQTCRPSQRRGRAWCARHSVGPSVRAGCDVRLLLGLLRRRSSR